MNNCIFCNVSQSDVIVGNKLAIAFYDKFPVNEGHILIVPKRHVETFFDAAIEELHAINLLIFEVKEILEVKFNPDGYNIGVNVGYTAGQTIFHLHYHVIPRYSGDVFDPRGGIRKIKNSIVPYLAEGE